MRRFYPWLSLFASTGTLFCCALPSLLVVLGMGATMASLVTTFPQLIWLSQYKGWVFLGSGMMLGIAGWFQWAAKMQSCPVDPQQANACKSSRNWSLVVFGASVALWLTGAFFAFLAPLLFR